ncbi:hypothetical protein Glove_271g33 [Diversispora epigaea]|uniref:BTB domain-containing protein n=1 Tax=Diversispora epigaea TaxID=1348612 RepID=A0A397I463_9GLOM|nr:hypothetical protein Glove_271g33 [Diversispora epigaea]
MSSKLGPYSGNLVFMRSNFTLDNECVCQNNGYYEKPIGTAAATEYFSIIDYEVFKIFYAPLLLKFGTSYDHEYKLPVEKNHYDEDNETIIHEDNKLSKSSSHRFNTPSRNDSTLPEEEENDEAEEEVDEVMDQLKVEIYEDICKEIALCWVWVKMVIEVFNEKLFLDPKKKKKNGGCGNNKSSFFDKLSQNFIELLNDKDDYNVIVEVENEKSFTAHSNVLKCRSPYFRKELENIIPNENNIKKITKPTISSVIFDIILKYIYGGIVNFEKVETRFIFDLMITANEFEIEELTKKLENLLIETKSSWLKSHFSRVYRSIFNGNNFKNLEKFCNDIIVKYPNLIFDAEDFTSLQKSAFVSLLKRDDLQLEEGIIWEYIIKWGIAQNSTLPLNLNEWTKENFLTLKTTLQQCLPLIRYFHISSADIWKKVKPYKKILDKQLWEDLNQYLVLPDEPVRSIILPPRTILAQELPTRTTEQAKSLSTIITYEHVAEISSWIDRKSSTYSLTNTPYEFQLILRGSIYGFNPQTFWDTCHGHAGTVMIIKVKGTDEIFGGYNPLPWDAVNTDRSGIWGKTNDSFIFSLKNGNIQNSIFSRVKICENAILNVHKDAQGQYGPYFGNGSFYMNSRSSNFTLDSYSACYDNGSYEKPIRTAATYKFSIVDYEVFEVIKKN